jgi:hypothetical protein
MNTATEEVQRFMEETQPVYICCKCEHEQNGGNNCDKCGSDKLEYIGTFSSFSAQPLNFTEEEMLEHLEFKGYEVYSSFDLIAKAEGLGFKFIEETQRWVK